MPTDQDHPFDREPWRRKLEAGDAQPSRGTDERIRAEARRALAPRTQSWWLPASLAASLVLAVLIVQWQFEDTRAPASITESDVAPTAEPAAGAETPAATLESPADLMDTWPVDAVAPAAPLETAVSEQGFTQESRVSEPAAAPMMDLPSAPVREEREVVEMKQQRADSPPRAAQEAAEPSGRSAAFGNLDAAKASDGDARTPEQWYAEIEALRKAGRQEEAEAELKRLEAAHPGWLEKYHPRPR